MAMTETERRRPAEIAMSHFRFLSTDRLPGVLILGGLIAGLAAVNSPLRPFYEYAHHATVHLGIGALTSDEPLILWINDGLMVFFFLLVGMEIKRELLEGHLSTFRQAALPAYAAVGGMAIPALIYAAVTWEDPAALRGWAVPTATDIVLAISMLALLGPRVPAALRAFLTALAIFDDIGAVLIIGLFYGKGLVVAPLAVAGLALVGLWLLNRSAVTRVWPYVAVGGILWAAMLSSGFEAALAGVLIGIAVPLRVPGHTPLRRVEREVEPWVSFVVIPLFAFFNSGVTVDESAFDRLLAPESMGIILGLFLGKPIGIFVIAWVAVRLGAGRLPRGVTWTHVCGAAIVAGIGFTMSLFVAALAFPDPQMLANAKLAVLTASLISASVGLMVLHTATRRSASAAVASAQPAERPR
ncbi:MAG: Na+/H+ antiporter NhaA [Bradyrhizobium sp.]|uniref:Na+/H+ antiporter NhaA n=1 Tax=Bradyrhizobium sp. TaxID=376 RepID=UPI0029AE6B3D|nr:Na+/H+ antiporter NhaA [Bradyrhizobium sp.]MDX3966913.1 Na+/H+ antiporter NhaA [Bradyrhizobium sp.]